MDSHYDIIIIGGGIHGVAIAADASGRGLSVLVCEQGDLANATSSASSKLLHGGLRYLEQYDFSLVRESLRERDRLIKMAPHLVDPLRFIVPVDNSDRSLWLIRLGLYLYDLMGYSRYFKRSKYFNFHNDRYPNPLKSHYKHGIIYSDATVDDARLVVTTALRAKANGAIILTRTKCIEVKESETKWVVQLENSLKKETYPVSGKVLINASGPWMNESINNIIKQKTDYEIRLVKGSHIVVPKITLEDKAYLLQHPDGRVIFVVPYQKHFTMIGTTDVPFLGKLDAIKIEQDEISYLCQIVSTYFKEPVSTHQILSSWSGVRPLLMEKSATPFTNTREYKIEHIKSSENDLPLINIFGGKLTTHRNLAEKAVNRLKSFFPQMPPPWTSTSPLPGGDLPERSLTLFLEEFTEKYPWLFSSVAMRYAQTYGTLSYVILGNAQSISDLGEHFGQGLYEKEVNYLVTQEWAMTSEDILWRRTKLGLFMSHEECEKLNTWLKANSPAIASLS